MQNNPHFDFSRLTPAERVRLARDLWNSITPEEAAELPLSDALRAELDRRLEELRRNPHALEQWEGFRDQLLEELQLNGDTDPEPCAPGEAGMPQTYRAVLHGDRLEWKNGHPAVDRPLSVVVTLTEEEEPLTDEERRYRGVEALERIAARGGIPSIPDAAEWQREIREDRPLPGREE